MSVGNIVVELELNDGKFVMRARKAGRVVNQLSGNFASLEKRVKSVERGIHGIIPTLRDIAIIGASARTVIHSLNDAFVSWTHGIIKSNAEIERLNMLMQGLSTASTLNGKIADAANEVDLLFQKAQKAPFAINELANSFVKLKTAGLDDVMGSLNSLTDAIASFGGDNQTLHRATIAIQQMASKGVVSMEELRQQLGESVPNAIKLMAVGMEMTVGNLVDAISSGTVRAKPAIAAMMLEFQKAMGGSSERMMTTWNGMMSQLTTKWIMFQKEIGDTGYFDAAKDALGDVTAALDTEEAALFAKSLGEALTEIIKGAKELVTIIVDNREAIASTTKALATFFLVTKGFSIVSGYLVKLVTGIAGLATAMRGLATVTVISTVPGLMGLATATTSVTTATTLGTRAIGAARIALAALGGPLGLIVTGLGLGAVAWSEYTDEADRAKQATIDAIKAGDNVEQGKDPGVSTVSEIAANAAGIESLRKRRDEQLKIVAETEAGMKNADALRAKYGQSFVDGENSIANLVKGMREGRLRDARMMAASMRELLITAEKGNYASLEKVIKSGSEKVKMARLKGMSKSISLLSSTYKTRLDIILKNEQAELDAMSESGKSEVEIRSAAAAAVRKISEDRFSDEIALAQSKIREIKDVMDNFAVGSKDAVAIHIIDTQKSKLVNDQAIESLKIDKERLLQEVDKIGNSGDARSIEIRTKLLPGIDAQIESKTAAIKSFVDHVSSMIAKLGKMIGVTDATNLLADTRGGLSAIEALTAKVAELQKKLDEVGKKDNFMMPDTKSAENGIKSLVSILNSASVKFEKLKAQNEEDGGSGYLEQQKQKIENVGKSAKDLIKDFDKLSNADKKMKLAAMIENIAIGVEQQQSIKDFTDKIEDLEKAANLTRNAIRRINGEQVKYDWIADEEKKLVALREEAARTAAAINNGTAGPDGKKDLKKLNVIIKTSEVNLKNANIARKEQNTADRALLLERSRLAAQKDRLKIERDIVIANASGTFDGAAQYKAEEDAIRNAFAAKLMLRERVGSEDLLGGPSQSVLALREESIEAIRLADVRERSIDSIIANEQRLANIQFAMQIDSKDKSIAMLNEESERRRVQAKLNAIDEQEALDEIFRINLEHAKSLELIDFEYRGPFARMVEDWIDSTDKMEAAATAFTDGFANQIADLVVDGKADFASLAKSFLKEMVKIEIKSASGNLMNILGGKGGPSGKPDGGGVASPTLSALGSLFGSLGLGGGVNAAQAADVDKSFVAVQEEMKVGWASLSTSIDSTFSTEVPELMSGIESSFGDNFGDLTGSMDDTLSDGFGGIFGSLSNLFSSIGSSLGNLLSGAGSAISGAGSSIVASLFAKGGTMGADMVSDSQMRKGGVATSAKMAIFGEASVPEAFIPMKDGRNVEVLMTSMGNGQATAVIPLPSGEMLSTRITMASGVGDDSEMNGSIRAFANGGAMGADTLSSINSSTSGGGAFTINNINIGQDVVSILKGVGDNIESVAQNIPDMGKIDTNSPEDSGSIANGGGLSGGGSGDVSITINVTDSGETTERSAGGKESDDGWNSVATKIKSIVRQEMALQKRHGGILSGN